MPLTSEIVPFDKDWKKRFSAEKSRLETVFSFDAAEIHHVGSTSVEGIAAKPEIDILVVVDERKLPSDWVDSLAELGYVQGSDLSIGHRYFRRDVENVRMQKLHVCREGHSEAARMIRFRDLLRSDALLKEQYEKLKLKLEKENTRGIGEYLDGKAPFVNQALIEKDVAT
ncbi:MAG: GrpB family protein [Pseudomonadales bacterium]|nr:GrpB family protein [Pseudomonadales bacterium]